MMHRFVKIILANLVALLLMSSSFSAFAVSITYIYEGFDASGSIGEAQFSNADFTVTALADTDNIGSWCCSLGQNTHISATINIDGFSTADIFTPSHSWYDVGTVGLGKDVDANWMDIYDPALIGYDLSTSIGPVFATAYGFSQFTDVSTSLGTLNFTDSVLEGSFQAIVGDVPDIPEVPVPAAVWLFGTALLGFVGMSRRRKVT